MIHLGPHPGYAEMDKPSNTHHSEGITTRCRRRIRLKLRRDGGWLQTLCVCTTRLTHRLGSLALLKHTQTSALSSCVDINIILTPRHQADTDAQTHTAQTNPTAWAAVISGGLGVRKPDPCCSGVTVASHPQRGRIDTITSRLFWLMRVFV